MEGLDRLRFRNDLKAAVVLLYLCIYNLAYIVISIYAIYHFPLEPQDRVLINQWKDEIINGFKLSAQIMANMNKKVRNKYGADFIQNQRQIMDAS